MASCWAAGLLGPGEPGETGETGIGKCAVARGICETMGRMCTNNDNDKVIIFCNSMFLCYVYSCMLMMIDD